MEIVRQRNMFERKGRRARARNSAQKHTKTGEKPNKTYLSTETLHQSVPEWAESKENVLVKHVCHELGHTSVVIAPVHEKEPLQKLKLPY